MQCHGCRLEVWKETHPGRPYKKLVIVWFIIVCSALPMSTLFPFVYFMVRDLHVAKRVEDIGIYVGLLGASMFVGRALTSIVWGQFADKYGRKPVLLIGSIAVVILNALFGLSVNYWMAITTRFILGVLNGLNGTVKAYSAEICPKEHEAFGLSIFSTAWGVGLILGPVIGGFLAMPAENFPNVVSKESFLGRFPYFLPCFCISILAAFASLSCYWLPETLHTHNKRRKGDEQTEGKDPNSVCSLLKNWPLMSSIIVYCVFSIHDMAYSELFSLWAVSDRKHGGLSYTSRDIGVILGISGFSIQVFQLIFYSLIEKRFGPIIASRAAAILSIPVLTAFPFLSKLTGVALFSTVTFASVLKLVLSMIIITGTFLLQNNAVSQDQRGAANGLSMTLQSICKAVGPAAAGSLFSWAQKRQNASFLPGDHIIFFLLNVIEFIGFILTFKPFLTVHKTVSSLATPDPGQLTGIRTNEDTTSSNQPTGIKIDLGTERTTLGPNQPLRDNEATTPETGPDAATPAAATPVPSRMSHKTK